MSSARPAYELLEHKADTGFLVKAPSWERLFINGALALTDMRVKLEQIEEHEKRKVKLSAEDKERLFVTWLNEVLFLFEHDRFLARRIVFEKFDGKTLEATIHGQLYEPVRHGHLSEIKAVTYHQLQLSEATPPETGFVARVFLDL